MDGLLTVGNNPNFGPTVSPWVFVGNDARPGEPVFTELAKSFMPLEGLTPLTELFPEENILERVVLLEQKFQGVDTIFPLVEMGKPDVVLGQGYGTTRQMYVQPLYIRRSAFVSYGEINSKLRPGTMNERWSPQEQISRVIQGMVREHNLTWNVYRAMMLLGGINYTDPRTGVGASVSSQIPSMNYWHYAVTEGYRGRNEANLFRTLVEYNDPAPATAGVPWTHPDADLVTCVQRFKRWYMETHKRRITRMYMSAELKEVLASNNQIKMITGGLLGVLNANPKQVSAETNIVPASAEPTYNITVGPDGLTGIAGVPIQTVDTLYKDPVDGIYKRIWPKNKVVFVAEQDMNGGNEAIGRTQFCVSEESGGQPGLWTRTQTETQIPAAPGMYVQMGNAGMPYLKYPYAVVHMTVGEIDQINNRLGVLGDLQFGQF